MIALLVVAYALSAVLPLIGLIGLFRSATNDARGLRMQPPAPGGDVSIGQDAELKKQQLRVGLEAAKYARRDLCLIGGGLILGAAASISSLFLAQ